MANDRMMHEEMVWKIVALQQGSESDGLVVRGPREVNFRFRRLW